MIDQPQQAPRVNVERLTRRMGKYSLVVAVSQRARQLKDRQSRLGDFNTTNLVGRALKEIHGGRVKVIQPSEE